MLFRNEAFDHVGFARRAQEALSGHGPAWRGSLREAIAQAREAGAA